MNLFRNLFGPHYYRSIWISGKDLGRKKAIKFKGKLYVVNIPKKVNQRITLRLKGLGHYKNNIQGDLYLQLKLSKGIDTNKKIWISESSAKKGTKKVITVQEQLIELSIPPNSYHGLTIRLFDLGKKPAFNWKDPFYKRINGCALINLCIFPDNVEPMYGRFDSLELDEMYLEGWVYRKYDELIKIFGKNTFQVLLISANQMANIFNMSGINGIFSELVNHLNLSNQQIKLITSNSIIAPGECHKTLESQDGTHTTKQYTIKINSRFLDNPFLIAAILAHELCHVIHFEKNDELYGVGRIPLNQEPTLEIERTVDLLVFMFKLGEFQLRAARDKRLTIGYFNQKIFERIQVIASRKINY